MSAIEQEWEKNDEDQKFVDAKKILNLKFQKAQQNLAE